MLTKLRQVYQTLIRDLFLREAGTSTFESTERNIRINVYHGIVSIMSVNLAGPFMGIFAVRAGASDFQVGLLSSGPALVSLLSMIPGGRLMDRLTDKKRTLMRLVLAQRFFYLLISLVPFFTPDRRAWLLVFAVALMNLPASIANIGWQAFISGVVPARRRAEAFAARNRLMNLAGTCVVLVAGRMIDIVGFPLGYQIAFTAAFIIAIAEVWVFDKIREVTDLTDPGASASGIARSSGPGRAPSLGKAMPRSSTGSLIGNLREVTRHKPFLRYAIASMVFYLCWQTAWPLFTLYQVKELGANNVWVSLNNLANTGGALLGYGFWARQMNRHGSLKTLFMSSFGLFAVPLVHAFSRSLGTIAVFNLISGVVMSGVNLALFNALLEVTPEGSKATYIAYYTTAVTASSILAPMLGVALLNQFGFFKAFLITSALRAGGSFVFLVIRYLESSCTTARTQRMSS